MHPDPHTVNYVSLYCHSNTFKQSVSGCIALIKAEHECTHGRPRSVPAGISNSKCYTWIRADSSHRVTRSRESKTHGFSSTCGSTGTWKYLQVLRILNTNNIVNFKCKYMWNKIILRHGVTPWRNQIWLDRPCASYYQSLSLTPSESLPCHFKNIVSYSSTYQKLTKCPYLGY